MFSLAELHAAEAEVRSAFQATPQYRWPLLCERLGAEVWTKHENHAPTGAFKVRGGLIHVGRLVRHGLAKNGLVCATRGNHGQSIAYAAGKFEVPVTVVVPHGNSAEKNAAMRALGARLVEHGDDFDDALAEARRLAEVEGLCPAPSFHRDLVVGVATCALELFTAAGELDVLYVPIGLGSGICGAILARDVLGLQTEIVGVQSTEAPAYALSFKAGRPVAVNSANTWADGLAVRVPDPGALEIMLAGAARIVTVDDAAIGEAIRAFWTDTHNLAEGAGAASLAAALQDKPRLAGRRVGVVLTGGNIDLQLFGRWIAPGA